MTWWMTMMAKRLEHQSWLKAIADAAAERSITFPPFTRHAMGGARSMSVADGRFVTFKRRLVPSEQAVLDGVEWALWLERDDLPLQVGMFREPLTPTPEHVTTAFSLIKGWLIDGWTVHETNAAVSKHPRAQPVVMLPVQSLERLEYWLSEDRGFGVVVTKDAWSLFVRGQSLTSWRVKENGEADDRLDLASLDRLCFWLARNWPVVAYGTDNRPLLLRGFPVAASRAYENAQLANATEKNKDISSWWSRHAIRAADSELPNVFFERQADEIIVSWDASPTSTRFYQIPAGEEICRVAVAVPILRRLVIDRLKLAELDPAARDEVRKAMSSDVAAGYAAVRRYNGAITDVWLARHGFSDSDAEELATSGTSRHPVVGLLRSSQGSSISAGDYDRLLRLLKPCNADSFAKLREMAKGLSPAINAREPWESGYRLAALVRERLGFATSAYVDIEDVIRRMDVEIQETAFADATIFGVCVGTPGYSPLIVLNSSCADATGVSGRRVTLAHEFCHLAFDRAGLRSLARFEGGGADSDRLIEMRANAFGVELLVPMSTLVGGNGVVVDDARLAEIAAQQKVSSHALLKHAKNLRNRLSVS